MNKKIREEYFSKIDKSFAGILETQLGNIKEASNIIASAITQGKLIFSFGSGLSFVPSLELFDRAGGLGPVDIIYDPTFGKTKNKINSGKLLLEKEGYILPPECVIIVISESGEDNISLEIAKEAKKQKLKVISLSPVKSKLFNISDVGINICLPNPKEKESTKIKISIAITNSAIIMNMIVIETITYLMSMGYSKLPIFISSNIDIGDEHNSSVYTDLKKRLDKLGINFHGSWTKEEIALFPEFNSRPTEPDDVDRVISDFIISHQDIENAKMELKKNKHLYEFWEKTIDILSEIENIELENIKKASEIISEALKNGKSIFAHGSGHSISVSLGGLGESEYQLPWNIIYDPTFGKLERAEGYAATLLSRGKYNITSGDVVVIISNSGRNALQIEIANEAKKIGATVIAITSLKTTGNSRHHDNKKLCDVADIVINNCVPAGDVTVKIGNLPIKTGSPSVLIGIAIMKTISIKVIENLSKKLSFLEIKKLLKKPNLRGPWTKTALQKYSDLIDKKEIDNCVF
ncbi:MAG: sugar isomerase domain-containing protein [Elusimicrobia bacterium]|nr:sugar isomerase domain-containing protein [Elusimicrobiota bacterium]